MPRMSGEGCSSSLPPPQSAHNLYIAHNECICAYEIDTLGIVMPNPSGFFSQHSTIYFAHGQSDLSDLRFLSIDADPD